MRSGSGPLSRGRHDHAPQRAVDDDRRAGRRTDPGAPDGVGERTRDLRVVVDARGRAGLAHPRGDCRAVKVPARPDFERVLALAPGTDHCRRPVGLVSQHVDVWQAERPADLLGHRGEHVRRAGAAGDDRRHAAQRRLLLGEDRVALTQLVVRAQPLRDVGERHDRAAALGHIERHRQVRDREHRPVASEEPVDVARDRLARRAGEEHRALGGRIWRAVRVGAMDRLVAGRRQELVGALIAEARRWRPGSAKRMRPSASTTQMGWAVDCSTAARKSSAPTFHPPRSVRGADTASRVYARPQAGVRRRRREGRISPRCCARPSRAARTPAATRARHRGLGLGAPRPRVVGALVARSRRPPRSTPS